MADRKKVEKKDDKEKELLDPENNTINVSAKQVPKFYIFLSKIILKKFGNLELRSLGKAAEICVRVAESLERCVTYNSDTTTRRS